MKYRLYDFNETELGVASGDSWMSNVVMIKGEKTADIHGIATNAADYEGSFLYDRETLYHAKDGVWYKSQGGNTGTKD
jgi:hypothetical protein